MRYQPTEKNRGKPPKLEDERMEYIKTDCGWCIECRKKLANEWRVRLLEEIKDYTESEFVTFTFAPNAIEKLESEIINKKYKGLQKGTVDVNILAAYAVRMFTERWRKKYKRVPRHWIITELGHEGSERLHMHGIVWNNQGLRKDEFIMELGNKWQYGNIDIGQKGVCEQAINYMMKYVTKLDEKNKGYRQKIFVSKGIGAGYVERNKYLHQYNGEKTLISYRTSNGYQMRLPRYWKTKLWNEEERIRLWEIALNRNKEKICSTEFDLNQQDDIKVREIYLATLKGARENNIQCGYGDNRTRNKRYVITELMKLDKKGILNYDKDKLVKCEERRTVNYTIKWDESKENSESLGKHMLLDIDIWGRYIGNITEGEKKKNKEIAESEEFRIPVRVMRLLKKKILSPKDIGRENDVLLQKYLTEYKL